MSRRASGLTLSTLLGLAGVAPREAEACDRPAISNAQRVGRADLAIRARVASTRGSTAEVEVLETLLGVPPAGRVHVEGVAEAEAALRCGGTPLVVGREYVLFSFSPRAGESSPRLIDPGDGVVPLPSPIAEEAIRLARAARAAPWTPGPDGLDVKLYASTPRPRSDEELDLYVLVRNSGSADRKLTLHTWPPERHAFCTLAFTPPVAAAPVPIAKADIADYFSKHGPRHEVTLRPGEVHELRLPRVTTAKPGWGYKEELGFRYYPAAKGRYAVRARCERYVSSPVEAGPVELTFEP